MKVEGVNGIKKNINRLIIAIDVIWGCVINKILHKESNNSKNVIIVFQQVFGDAVIFSDSLRTYEKLFPLEEGYRLKLLARSAVVKFMRDTLLLPSSLVIEEVDFGRYLSDYRYYRLIKKNYSRWAGTVIVPGTSLSAEIFSTMCHAKRRIGLVRSVPNKWPISAVVFQKLAYTERVRPEKELMMLQRHRLLLNYLGEKDFVSKLPKLQEQKRIIEGTYCVVCPGASKTEKCWPIDCFASVIEYIVNELGLKVCLCGGVEDVRYEDILINRAQKRNMIDSYIGKTTFKEWSSIVQHANLVIGNDSATMHLAAAARVPSVCIAGVYDKYQFFPYKVDVVEKDDILPTTIYKEMPCEWCRTLGYYSGFNNSTCKRLIKTGKCAICISSISVNEVIEKIKETLHM